jgi:cystathionine beta-synthase
VCTLVPDSGNKYLSKMYDDAWMADQGLLERPRAGDLRDLVARRAADGAVVSVKPDEPLLVAYGRMKQHDVSQLPVLEDGRIVGMLDESDLLAAAADDEAHLRDVVRDHMTTRLVTVAPSAPLRELLPLFAQGLVPIVKDGDTFLGLVTRMDVVNHLRRRLG